MKIYIIHSREFDFESQLYAPIKACQSLMQEHEVILPHDANTAGQFSKPIIDASDIIFAEISFPSTGMGIELGWAHAANKTIICLCKHNKQSSSSIKYICKSIISYAENKMIPDIMLQYIN